MRDPLLQATKPSRKVQEFRSSGMAKTHAARKKLTLYSIESHYAQHGREDGNIRFLGERSSQEVRFANESTIRGSFFKLTRFVLYAIDNQSLCPVSCPIQAFYGGKERYPGLIWSQTEGTKGPFEFRGQICSQDVYIPSLDYSQLMSDMTSWTVVRQRERYYASTCSRATGAASFEVWKEQHIMAPGMFQVPIFVIHDGLLAAMNVYSFV